MRLLSLGVPTIVSDRESFSCLPDAVVRKHHRDRDGLAGLSRMLCELAVDRQDRRAMGRAALNYVRAHHDWARVADAYEEIIEATAVPRAARTSSLPRPHSPPRRIALRRRRKPRLPPSGGLNKSHPQSCQVRHESFDQEGGPNPLADNGSNPPTAGFRFRPASGPASPTRSGVSRALSRTSSWPSAA